MTGGRPRDRDTNTEVGWVHLPDLALDQSDVWRQALPALSTDLRRTLEREELVPDLVLISGDLTAHGQAVEYERVDRFLDELCAHMQRDFGVTPLILAIPGDRDLRRPRGIVGSWMFELIRRHDETGPHGKALRTQLWRELGTSFVEPLFGHYLDWARRRMPERDELGDEPGRCYLRSRVESHFPGRIGHPMRGRGVRLKAQRVYRPARDQQPDTDALGRGRIRSKSTFDDHASAVDQARSVVPRAMKGRRRRRPAQPIPKIAPRVSRPSRSRRVELHPPLGPTSLVSL